MKTGRKPGPHPALVMYHGIDGEMRMAYNRMKAQAKFRDEEFTLDWESFQSKWANDWQSRGVSNTSYCMSRLDYRLAWSNDNTVVITRMEHCQLRGKFKGHTDAN